jgi:putative SOS response-associated peptidase YedK
MIVRSWHLSSTHIIFDSMCGRIIQSSRPLRLAIVEGLDVSDSRIGNIRPRYNGAPSQELLVIRQNHRTGERSLDQIRWG